MNLDYKRILWSLVVGFLVGAALARWAGVGSRRHWNPAEHERRMMRRVSAQLELTPGQQERLRAILDEKRQKVDALRAEFKPRFDALHQSMRVEIRQMLDEKQQARFDVLERDWEAKRKHREAAGGTPPLP